MAMLAEPRRKQKWTLNPRGKQWSEDSNKFGQKMLEKMGWTSGKGLGANEQGMTEHVKVSYKNNQSGIGFKDRGDQWTRHQEDFNHFLSQLQEQNSNSEGAEDTETNKSIGETEESLELKSRQSRARVHYHKFTRGKDVKKYSAKDLANIFGKKDLKDSAHVPKAEEIIEEIIAEPRGSRDNRGGVLTVKGGSIDEYFKNKSLSFIRNGDSRNADDSEDEYEPRLGFGFSSASEKASEHDKSNTGFGFANEGLDLEYPEKTIESKARGDGFAYDNPCLSPEKRKDLVQESPVPFCGEGFVNPALNLNDLTNDDNNGAEFEVSRVEFGLDNNALDLSDEDGRKRRVTFNERVEYSTDVVKKKKKKRKGKDKLDKFEVDNSKLKKPKETAKEIEAFASGGIEAEGFVNEALEIEPISDEVNDNEANERKTKKSKRKKNRRTLSLETIEETAEEISQIDESEIGEAVLLDEEVSPRKNKKLRKSFGVEKTNSEANQEVFEVEIEASGAKKKKKKEKVVVLEESAPEKRSSKKKEKTRRSEEAEITVLAEISRKICKAKKNRVGNESESSDQREEAIESSETKKKSKKRSKLKDEEPDIVEISTEANGDSDVQKNTAGAGKKRKINSGEESGSKSGKKSKLDIQPANEDEENVEQNGEVPANATSLSPRGKKNKKSRKSFKSLFAKAPTLYFSGSNINEMAGYGATVTELKLNN